MITLADIKARLRQRLIDTDGNVPPHELLDILTDAADLGLTEKEIAGLLPQVDSEINWEQIRHEKKAETELLLQEEVARKRREQEEAEAPEHLAALLSLAMSDGIVEAEELRIIFEKGDALKCRRSKLAIDSYRQLQAANFKPLPTVTVSGQELSEILMAASWYSPIEYARIMAAAPVPEVHTGDNYYEEPENPVIHYFRIDKAQIQRGESAMLFWKVSGVKTIDISGIGLTSVLEGREQISPASNHSYRLYAGKLMNEVQVQVTEPRRQGRATWPIICLILIATAIGIAWKMDLFKQATQPIEGDMPLKTALGPLQVGKMNASSNIGSDVEAGIVSTMNYYLQVQAENEQSAIAISRACDLYDYPVRRYFSQKNASRAYVYNDISRYRAKYRHDQWQLDISKTRLRKEVPGLYSVVLAGQFSYYIRNPKVSDGFKSLYVIDSYVLNQHYKVIYAQQFK